MGKKPEGARVWGSARHYYRSFIHGPRDEDEDGEEESGKRGRRLIGNEMGRVLIRLAMPGGDVVCCQPSRASPQPSAYARSLLE